MGRFGHYLFQVAQWYPQVAMYDDMRGWDTDQYLGIGEFYNQFGSYDVRITLPERLARRRDGRSAESRARFSRSARATGSRSRCGWTRRFTS